MDREVAHRLGRLEASVTQLSETGREEAIATAGHLARLETKIDQLLTRGRKIDDHDRAIAELKVQLNMRTLFLGALSAIAGALGLRGTGFPTP